MSSPDMDDDAASDTSRTSGTSAVDKPRRRRRSTKSSEASPKKSGETASNGFVPPQRLWQLGNADPVSTAQHAAADAIAQRWREISVKRRMTAALTGRSVSELFAEAREASHERIRAERAAWIKGAVSSASHGESAALGLLFDVRHGLTKKAKATTNTNKRYFVYNHNVAPACTCRSTCMASRPVL